MNWVDFAIASSLFLVFIALVIILTINYFSNLQNANEIVELRKVAFNFFKNIFTKKGIPEDWYLISENPSSIGLMSDIYQIPIVVEEDDYNRTNEIVEINLTFDKNCEKNILNSSVRVFNEDYNEIDFVLKNQDFCGDNLIRSGKLVWEVNMSRNQSKRYFVYYSSENIDPINYTINSSLVGYWKFDEGCGNTVYDSSTKENDGNLYNGTTRDTGKYNYGIKFDGVNDVIIVPYDQSFDFTNEFTTEFWIKLDRISEGNVLNKWSDGSEDKKITINGSGYVEFYLYNVMGGSPLTSTTSLSINQWYHIATVYDGSEAKIYINGILDNTKPASGDIGDSNSDLRVGYIFRDGSEVPPINGTIDELRIYNRGLTQEEINISYRSSPITVKTFPELKTKGISINRIDGLRNKSIDNIRKTLGSDYKFKIEVYEP